MSEPRQTRVVIIGSGPAGYTAAIYAARALLNPVLIAGIQPGGQLTITTDVENYPGFADVIQGPWLMEQMEAQARHVGTEIVNDTVVEADLSSRPFRLVCDSGQVWLAETVIIATGAQAKWLGLESEQRFRGFGVSACATCDGFFYRNKQVAVVGGGNTAVEEALFLTSFASKVTVIHRRDEFRAERILQERLFAHPKIEVIWNTGVESVVGTESPMGVTGVNYIQITAGSLQRPLLKDVSPKGRVPVIRTRRSALESLLEGGGTVLARAVDALDRVNAMLSDRNLATIQSTLTDVQAVTADLRSRRELLDHLDATIRSADVAAQRVSELTDSANRLVNGEAKRTLGNLAQAAEELKGAAQDGRSMIAGLQGPTTDFATNALPQVSATLIQLQATTESLNRVISDIETNPGRLISKPAAKSLEVQP